VWRVGQGKSSVEESQRVHESAIAEPCVGVVSDIVRIDSGVTRLWYDRAKERERECVRERVCKRRQ